MSDDHNARIATLEKNVHHVAREQAVLAERVSLNKEYHEATQEQVVRSSESAKNAILAKIGDMQAGIDANQKRTDDQVKGISNRMWAAAGTALAALGATFLKGSQ